jgi:hypothetical protein
LTDIDAIGALRDQLAGLLSQIDSSAKPRPDKVNGSDERLPGPEWERSQWVVRCIDNDRMQPTCVYITPPHWYHERDIDALRTDDARKFAMAILAACDWADGIAANVTPLDKKRPA